MLLVLMYRCRWDRCSQSTLRLGALLGSRPRSIGPHKLLNRFGPQDSRCKMGWDRRSPNRAPIAPRRSRRGCRHRLPGGLLRRRPLARRFDAGAPPTRQPGPWGRQGRDDRPRERASKPRPMRWHEGLSPCPPGNVTEGPRSGRRTSPRKAGSHRRSSGRTSLHRASRGWRATGRPSRSRCHRPHSAVLVRIRETSATAAGSRSGSRRK